MGRKKTLSLRHARSKRRKESTGTMVLPGISIYHSGYVSLITELARHWKSNGIGVPPPGSSAWKMWTTQLGIMGQQLNVQLTMEQISELLKGVLSSVDYLDGSTQYAKSVLGSSLKQLVDAKN